VLLARAEVVDGVIHEERREIGLGLNLLPCLHAVGRLHVGAEDRLKAPRAAQLRLSREPALRVDHLTPAPPSARLEHRLDFLPPVGEGCAVRQRRVERGPHLAQHVHVHHLCHREGVVVRFAQHVGVAECRPQALRAEEVDRTLGCHVEGAAGEHVEEVDDAGVGLVLRGELGSLGDQVVDGLGRGDGLAQVGHRHAHVQAHAGRRR